MEKWGCVCGWWGNSSEEAGRHYNNCVIALREKEKQQRTDVERMSFSDLVAVKQYLKEQLEEDPTKLLTHDKFKRVADEIKKRIQEIKFYPS